MKVNADNSIRYEPDDIIVMMTARGLVYYPIYFNYTALGNPTKLWAYIIDRKDTLTDNEPVFNVIKVSTVKNSIAVIPEKYLNTIKKLALKTKPDVYDTLNRMFKNRIILKHQ